MKDSYDYPAVLATYRVEIAAEKIPNLFACFSPESSRVRGSREQSVDFICPAR